MATLRIADSVGRVLGDRYRLTRPLGTGASAHVYVADDVTLRRRVAVKVLHPGLADDEGFLRRFQAEARAVAALHHPNILHVYDWGYDDGSPYLVTDLLEGGSLRAMLDRSALLTPSQATAVGRDAAAALAHAHRRGLVHRDIKPANLLFDEEGRVCIADFGLARALAESTVTEPAGAVIGTARYAAPEQVRGRTLDARADVYSLALVLVEATTGTVPFAADTILATLMGRLSQPLRAPDTVGPLASVIAAAGTIDPADRLDAAGMGRALEVVARSLPPPAVLPLAGPLSTGEVERDSSPTEMHGASGARRPRRLPTPATVLLRHDGQDASPPPADPSPSTAGTRAWRRSGARFALPPSPPRPHDDAASGRPNGPSGENDSGWTLPAGDDDSGWTLSAGDDDSGWTLPAGDDRRAAPPAGNHDTGVVAPLGSRSGDRVSSFTAIGDSQGGATDEALDGAPSDVVGRHYDPRRGSPGTVGRHGETDERAREDVRRGDDAHRGLRDDLRRGDDAHRGLRDDLRRGDDARREDGGETWREAGAAGSRGHAGRGPWRAAILAAVIVLLLVAGGVSAWVLVHPAAPLETVPALRGQTEAQAAAALDRRHLLLTVAGRAYDPTAPAGTVTGQTPAGGRLREHLPVAVTLSLGPQPVEVPEHLIGLSQVEATKVIDAVGLQLGRVSTGTSLTVAAGDVMASSPSSGTLLPGAVVALVISTGKPHVTVPALTGPALKSYAAAAAALRAAHLVPSQQLVYSDSVAAGSVIATEPGATTSLLYGSPVAVEVSKGPHYATVPSVAGDTVAGADQTLSADGFVVTGVKGNPSASVSATDPGVGQTILYGSSIEIVTG